MLGRYEKADEFWSISKKVAHYEMRWGKIGTSGDFLLYPIYYYEGLCKRANEKVREGYKLVKKGK